jgi:hypothetical protein
MKKNSTDSTSNFVMTFGISKDMSIDREIISSPDDAAALAFFLLVHNFTPISLSPSWTHNKSSSKWQYMGITMCACVP